MGKPIRIAILADSRGARGDIKQTETALGRLEKVGSRVGPKIAIGAALAGGALLKLGFDSVSSASDSQQSIGATESVFKQYADTVIKRSNEAANAVGLSVNEYRELSNQLGAMLKNTGRPLKETADLSDKLTARAADMAAMFGGTTREALESVSAALRGETDPIEKFGVSIKESSIQAYLAAKGLGGLKGAALDQAKAQARVALIFDQTKDAAGQFARESDTLAGTQQRLGAKVENLKSKLGTALLPVMVDLAGVAEKKLVPAIEDGVEAFEDWWPSAVKTGTALGKHLGPPLKTAAEVVGGLVDVVKAIPGPLLVMGVQAGVAALVFPRLAAGAVAAGTAMRNGATYARVLNLELRDANTRGALASSAMGKLGGAARSAAGVGGMVALAQGASSSNSAISALSSVGGGALMGFSVAGPIGAAIGAGAFGLLELGKAALGGKDKTGQLAQSTAALKVSAEQVSALAATYDEVTGAATRATRAGMLDALVKDERGKILNSIGISNRDAINAQLGNEAAVKRVNAAFRASDSTVASYQAKVDDATAALALYNEESQARKLAGAPVPAGDAQRFIDLARGLNDAKDALKEQTAAATTAKNAWTAYSAGETKARAQFGETKFALANLSKGLREAFPDKGRRNKISTELEVIGGPPAFEQLRKLKRQYDLTPKQVRTIIRTTGAKVSEDELQRLVTAGKGVSKQAPKVKVTADTKGAKGELQVLRVAMQALKDAKVKGPNLVAPVRAAANAAAPEATQGGARLGGNLSAGAAAGVRARAGEVAIEAQMMVRRAVNAANAEAQVRSPSRKTRKLGLFLGAGLVVGLDKSKEGVAKAATRLIKKGTIAAMVKAAESGASGPIEAIQKKLDKNADGLIKRFNANHKGAKQAKARAKYERLVNATKKAAIKGIKTESAALAVNRAKHAAVSSELDTAKTKLDELQATRQSYIDSTKQTFIDSGSLMGLGEGDGFGSLDQMLSQLDGKAASAEKFAAVIDQLRAAGLSQTALDQLVAAGPAAAMGTAETLLAGGQTAVNKVNELQTRIEAAGVSLGTKIANQYYNAGIAAQQGVVAGLTSDMAALDAAAEVIAERIVKQIKKKLKIKSPSRVTRLLGRFTGQGLAQGVAGEADAVQKAATLLAQRVEVGAASVAPVIPIRPGIAVDTAALTGAGGTGFGSDRHVYIHLTSDEVTQLQRGRTLTGDADNYSAMGGRKRA